MLAHYDPQLPIVLAVDVSPYEVGAVISHRMPNGEEKPPLEHCPKVRTTMPKSKKRP